MADDAFMLDQAMDIDNDVPPVPSMGTTPAATPQSLLRTHRNRPNANEKRGHHDVLKRHRDASIQKHPSNLDNHRRKNLGHANHTRDQANIRRNRKLRIQHAIASGSFLVRSLSNLAEIYGPSAVDQDQPEKLQRLNKDLITQALCTPVPGMAFDPSSLPSFTEAEMDDLVHVLEAHQMHLASKGKIVLSSEAGRLLRAFAREMMAVMLLSPEKLGCRIGADEFWAQVNLDYLRKKKIRWLTPRVMQLLKSGEAYNLLRRTGSKRDDRASSSALADVIMRALDAPGKCPVIDQAIAEASEDLPTFTAAQPSTLRSLIGHFEAARSRYLKNLNTSVDQGHQNSSYTLKPKQEFGMLSRNGNQYDSDNEDDGAQAGIEDGGIEDNAQVEDGVPSGYTVWFLRQLDEWIALKNGLAQGGVEVDMFSALDLI